MNETYLQQKRRHQEEFGKFDGIFFAFSNEQFAEGLEKVKFNKETDKIVSIGAGGYVLKSRIDEFKTLVDRHDKERKQLRKNTKQLIDAIAYELANHEYCITGSVTDALAALDLTRETVDADILKRAIKKHNAGHRNS